MEGCFDIKGLLKNCNDPEFKVEEYGAEDLDKVTEASRELEKKKR